jgi:hypothetical protein
MNDEPHDYVAISAEGHVYAILAADAPEQVFQDFVHEILDGGDIVKRIPRSEAVRRHLEYLDRMTARLGPISA